MAKSQNISSIQYNQQPFWFNALNKTWQAGYSVGLKTRIDKDDLIKSARKSTGFNDFGDTFWEEPLDRMLYSVEHEAALHPIGRFITRQRLIQLLSVRLRAEWWFKKYPEILEQPLYPVFLIVGLQRTGTTKLQRLLASDKDNRALLSWEALNPAPLDKKLGSNAKRIKAARLSENALKKMSPGFFAIHPVEHLAPEEDVLLLDTSFLSTTAEATMHVPSYASWLETIDQSPAYEYMVKLLKLLQWQRPGKRWILKTPHHLEFLDLAQKHLVDVKFIWTHRPVEECVPSFFSMVSFARTLFSNDVTREAVAEHWLRKIGYMLQNAMQFYSEGNYKNNFLHINYSNLVKNPIVELENIYHTRGLSIDNSLKDVLDLANQKNPKGKYGHHNYNPEDFGLSKSMIQQELKKYVQFQEKVLTKKV